MRPVVVIKARAPADVFDSGKKVLVKKVPRTAKPKAKPRAAATPEPPAEDSGESERPPRKVPNRVGGDRAAGLPKGLVAEQENSGRRRRRRHRGEDHSSSDEFDPGCSSSDEGVDWDPRKTSEVIARHRGLSAYVTALKAEINTLQERLANEAGTAPRSADMHSKRILFYQQQNATLTRRLRRQIRQTMRLRMRLSRLGAEGEESLVVANAPYDQISDVLAGGTGQPCRCTKAICVLVEAIEEAIPSCENMILENRLEQLTRHRDRLFNENVALKDRVATIQLAIDSDPFLAARLNDRTLGLDLNCALTKDEQRVVLVRKLQGLEILNNEIENQLILEKSISRQWRPELRRITTTIAGAFSHLFLEDQQTCWLAEKMSSVAHKLAKVGSGDPQGEAASETYKFRIRQDAKRIQFYIERIAELERQIVFMANPAQQDLTADERLLASSGVVPVPNDVDAVVRDYLTDLQRARIRTRRLGSPTHRNGALSAATAGFPGTDEPDENVGDEDAQIEALVSHVSEILNKGVAPEVLTATEQSRRVFSDPRHQIDGAVTTDAPHWLMAVPPPEQARAQATALPSPLKATQPLAATSPKRKAVPVAKREIKPLLDSPPQPPSSSDSSASAIDLKQPPRSGRSEPPSAPSPKGNRQEAKAADPASAVPLQSAPTLSEAVGGALPPPASSGTNPELPQPKAAAGSRGTPSNTDHAPESKVIKAPPKKSAAAAISSEPELTPAEIERGYRALFLGRTRNMTALHMLMRQEEADSAVDFKMFVTFIRRRLHLTGPLSAPRAVQVIFQSLCRESAEKGAQTFGPRELYRFIGSEIKQLDSLSVREVWQRLKERNGDPPLSAFGVAAEDASVNLAAVEKALDEVGYSQKQANAVWQLCLRGGKRKEERSAAKFEELVTSTIFTVLKGDTIDVEANEADKRSVLSSLKWLVAPASTPLADKTIEEAEVVNRALASAPPAPAAAPIPPEQLADWQRYYRARLIALTHQKDAKKLYDELTDAGAKADFDSVGLQLTALLGIKNADILKAVYDMLAVPFGHTLRFTAFLRNLEALPDEVTVKDFTRRLLLLYGNPPTDCVEAFEGSLSTLVEYEQFLELCTALAFTPKQASLFWKTQVNKLKPDRTSLYAGYLLKILLGQWTEQNVVAEEEKASGWFGAVTSAFESMPPIEKVARQPSPLAIPDAPKPPEAASLLREEVFEALPPSLSQRVSELRREERSGTTATEADILAHTDYDDSRSVVDTEWAAKKPQVTKLTVDEILAEAKLFKQIAPEAVKEAISQCDLIEFCQAETFMYMQDTLEHVYLVGRGVLVGVHTATVISQYRNGECYPPQRDILRSSGNSMKSKLEVIPVVDVQLLRLPLADVRNLLQSHGAVETGSSGDDDDDDDRADVMSLLSQTTDDTRGLSPQSGDGEDNTSPGLPHEQSPPELELRSQQSSLSDVSTSRQEVRQAIQVVAKHGKRGRQGTIVGKTALKMAKDILRREQDGEEPVKNFPGKRDVRGRQGTVVGKLFVSKAPPSLKADSEADLRETQHLEEMDARTREIWLTKARPSVLERRTNVEDIVGKDVLIAGVNVQLPPLNSAQQETLDHLRALQIDADLENPPIVIKEVHRINLAELDVLRDDIFKGQLDAEGLAALSDHQYRYLFSLMERSVKRKDDILLHQAEQLCKSSLWFVITGTSSSEESNGRSAGVMRAIEAAADSTVADGTVGTTVTVTSAEAVVWKLSISDFWDYVLPMTRRRKQRVDAMCDALTEFPVWRNLAKVDRYPMACALRVEDYQKAGTVLQRQWLPLAHIYLLVDGACLEVFEQTGKVDTVFKLPGSYLGLPLSVDEPRACTSVYALTSVTLMSLPLTELAKSPFNKVTELLLRHYQDTALGDFGSLPRLDANELKLSDEHPAGGTGPRGSVLRDITRLINDGDGAGTDCVLNLKPRISFSRDVVLKSMSEEELG